GLQLLVLAGRQGGLEGDRGLQNLHILHAAEDLAHELAAGGGPGAVLDQGHLPVFQGVVGDVVEQVLHGDEDAVVVGGGGENDVAVLEGVGQHIGVVGDRHVVHLHGDPQLGQAAGQNIGRRLRAAVDRGEGDEHALHLGLIGG